MSLRDLFLNLSVAKERFYVPEIDAEVEIRGITARQRAILNERCTSVDRKGNVNTNMQTYWPMLLTMSLYEPETGEAVFKEGDLDAVAGLPAGLVDRLAIVASRLSGLGAEQEAEKN